MGCALGSLVSCCACSAASCCMSASCSMCGKTVACTKSKATRGVYVFQFLLVAVVAFLFNTYAGDWLKNVPVIQQCFSDQLCTGVLAVHRICFGLTIYHALFAVFLIGAKNSTDWRVQFQDSWWPVKFLVLIGLEVAAFFIPNSFFSVYDWITAIGAGFFVIIQLLLLIEFAYGWNESWLRKMEDQEDQDGGHSWYYALLGATFLMLAAGIAFTGVEYKFFAHDGCGLNTFFITANLVVALLYCGLSVHPKVREGRPSSGMLQSAVVFLYGTYLVWSAMSSEPDLSCNRFGSPINEDGTQTKSQLATVIVGAFFTIVSVVYSTFRAANSSDAVLGGDVEKPLIAPTTGEDGDESKQIVDDEIEHANYNYSFFHVTFALGAMYICMLLTNWQVISRYDTPEHATGYTVDMGWGSVWVKIVSGWITILMYFWTLAAPVIFPDRDWS